LLIEKSADVNKARNSNGTTPLYIAAQKGHLKVVRLLIEKSADVNKARNDGTTPLFIAAWFGHLEVLLLLIDKGADILPLTPIVNKNKVMETH
jgi:ankyrin repeat protein